jgi:metal-sulfur cluster biosynthetic enzyme
MNVSIGDVIDPITPVLDVALGYVHSVCMNQKIVFVKMKMTVVITSSLRTFD